MQIMFALISLISKLSDFNDFSFNFCVVIQTNNLF